MNMWKESAVTWKPNHSFVRVIYLATVVGRQAQERGGYFKRSSKSLSIPQLAFKDPVCNFTGLALNITFFIQSF